MHVDINKSLQFSWVRSALCLHASQMNLNLNRLWTWFALGRSLGNTLQLDPCHKALSCFFTSAQPIEIPCHCDIDLAPSSISISNCQPSINLFVYPSICPLSIHQVNCNVISPFLSVALGGVEGALHGLLGFLTSARCSPTQHLEQEQALARQFAEILHFTLRFDELKVCVSTLIYRSRFSFQKHLSVPLAAPPPCRNSCIRRIRGCGKTCICMSMEEEPRTPCC